MTMDLSTQKYQSMNDKPGNLAIDEPLDPINPAYAVF
jgi:hypothetical protein